MAIHNNMFFFLSSLLFFTFLQIQTKVFSFQYKVGDLNAWSLPSSTNPQIYTKWSKLHNFTLGDSLLFLYPPSQDSLIQVSEQSYKSCNIKDPILFINNGNSLFNITSSHGDFYFTSGVNGHCQKNQKIHISVGGIGNVDVEEANSPNSLPANGPSYQAAFGNIPVAPSSSNSHHITSTFHVFIIGFGSVIYALLFGLM
ncbi:stellacyanin [Lathyrus oleraceus]|uniref:Phytocyanin domain-containing protein n=1 Tax=Pisum sativum TaxID=3888 RepID=A0A9D4W4B3_PEA|nr:stellacyanin [Pisum sativum]KAI5394842.1 hypothetical protein KIW84_061457 [Pisum sativum]